MGEPKRAAPAGKPRRRALKWFLGTLMGLLVVALAATSFYAFHMTSGVQKIQRSAELLPGPDAERPPETDMRNFMILGSDARTDDERGRSDVLMLAHIPTDRSKVYIISFSRDLYVEVPGRGMDKFNHAFAKGGVPLAVLTMENLLGIRIDHVAKIDFDGFIAVTDLLGGVTVNNRVSSSADPYHWPKGEVTVSGEEALLYVRQRKELPRGTVDRMERQRAVLKAMLGKIMTPKMLADPVKFGKVTGELGQHIVTDDQLTTPEMFSLATSMRVSGTDDVRMMLAPIARYDRDSKGRWIDVPNDERMAELAEALQNDRMHDFYVKYANVDPVG